MITRSLVVTRGLWNAILVSVYFICSLDIFVSITSARAAELQNLAASSLGIDQGVFVQAEDGTILVAQQEARPVSRGLRALPATTADR